MRVPVVGETILVEVRELVRSSPGALARLVVHRVPADVVRVYSEVFEAFYECPIEHRRRGTVLSITCGWRFAE